jgi:hypothetical protein
MNNKVVPDIQVSFNFLELKKIPRDRWI